MNINNYKELLNYLNSIKDEKYKQFHSKLLKNDNIKLLGVRTPKLKEIAKYLSKKDYQEYINTKHNTYEECIIHGLILGYLNIEFESLLKQIDKFIPYIDNWATCDLTVSNLKQFKKNQEQGYKYINKCLKSKNIWKQRVGVVLLNSYYINDNYIDNILELLPTIKTNEYYLEMAIAWCLSTCYIKYPNKIIVTLKNNELEKTIHNKTIQKIIESTRVSIEEKDKLRQLKIRTF